MSASRTFRRHGLSSGSGMSSTTYGPFAVDSVAGVVIGCAQRRPGGASAAVLVFVRAFEGVVIAMTTLNSIGLAVGATRTFTRPSDASDASDSATRLPADSPTSKRV